MNARPRSFTSRFRALRAISLVAALAAPVSGATGPVLGAEPLVESTTLPNGITLVTEWRPESRVAGVAVAVRAGSRFEDDATDSAAKMLSRMYLQGTENRPSREEILKPVHRLGGGFGVLAGWETLVFQASVRTADIDVALDVISDSLLHSIFDPDKLDKEIDLALQEFAEMEDQPPALAGYVLQRTLFEGQGMGHVPAGSLDGVERITREALETFRQRWVGSNRTVVAIVSPYGHAELVDRVGTAFAEFAPVIAPSFLPTDLSRAVAGRRDISAGSDQAIVVIGAPIPGATHPDRAALTVTVSALNGFTGRLMYEIRDLRGLAYGTSASQRATSDGGMFEAEAATDPRNAEALVGILQEQLQILADQPLADAELHRAIGQAQGQRLLANETAYARATDLAGSWSLGVTESIADFEARLAAVTTADVQRVARTYLAGGRQLHVVVAP